MSAFGILAQALGLIKDQQSLGAITVYYSQILQKWENLPHTFPYERSMVSTIWL